MSNIDTIILVCHSCRQPFGELNIELNMCYFERREVSSMIRANGIHTICRDCQTCKHEFEE